MRYFARICFDGTDFFGWQIQPNQRTIQEEIEQVLQQITQENIHIVGCGRTDAGVHASTYFFHVDVSNSLPENIVYKLNSMLPTSIVIQQMFLVPDDLHARFSADSRSYVYHLHFTKNPFTSRFSYYCFYKQLNVELMQQVVSMLPSIKDFAPLSKRGDEEHTICNIYEAKLLSIEDENRMELHVTANRFLHNMIRRIVGLLISVGRQKLTIEEVNQVLNVGGNFRINFVAPPQGLFLCGVEYNHLNE